MLMAGLDGIQRRLDASRFGPLDVNTYQLPPEQAAQVKSVPGSLGAALEALECDHDWLLEGNVFTRDLLETWVSYKREKELREVEVRPHPYEFYLYFDI
jgi:glutamine synthetase